MDESLDFQTGFFARAGIWHDAAMSLFIKRLDSYMWAWLAVGQDV